MDLQKSSKMLILSTKIPNLHYFCHSKNVPYKTALLFKWLLNPSFMQKKYIIVMNQFWENGFTNSLSKIPVLISFMSFYGDFPKFSCKLCNKKFNKNAKYCAVQWRIQGVWETGIPVWVSKLCCQKTIFKFSVFGCISTKNTLK